MSFGMGYQSEKRSKSLSLHAGADIALLQDTNLGLGRGKEEVRKRRDFARSAKKIALGQSATTSDLILLLIGVNP